MAQMKPCPGLSKDWTRRNKAQDTVMGRAGTSGQDAKLAATEYNLVTLLL
jgi:hypothetical protein